MTRIHGKEFATILKHESESRHHDAAAHSAIIALNERDHVAFIIGGTQIDRVTLIQGRIAGLDLLCRVIWVDQLAKFG
jgi:hypothetical protein